MGFIITFFYDPIAAAFGPAASLPEQLVWVVLAVLVTALGASLYQTADLGIAPYDYLSLGLRDYTHFQYFGCRVFTDAFCALLCWLLGGLVGLGTLICASDPSSSSSTASSPSGSCSISPKKHEHNKKDICRRQMSFLYLTRI